MADGDEAQVQVQVQVTKYTVVFASDKETKNTVRYEKDEVRDWDAFPFWTSLYLTKAHAEALGNPATLVVTIESGD